MINTTTPPAPENGNAAPKISGAVFLQDNFKPHQFGWAREVSFWFDGEEYTFGLEAVRARSEVEARAVLYADRANKELYTEFLKQVLLDPTLPKH